MRIKFRVLLIVLLALIFIVAANYLHFLSHFQMNMDAWQKAKVQEELHSVGALLDDELQKIEGITVDWAIWDDTYEYVVSRNDEYIQRNLYAETMATLDVDAVVIFDNNFRTVYAKDYEDSGSSAPDNIKLFEGYRAILCRDGNIDDPVTGMVADDAVYLVAAVGISDSVMSKGKAGTLVFARRLDAGVLAHLGNVTDSRVRLFDLKEQEWTRYTAPATAEGEYIGSVSDQENVGVQTVKDITGETRIGIAVYKERITGIAASGADAMLTSFSLSIVAIIVMILILFRVFITKPIDQIMEHLENIDVTGQSGYKMLQVRGNNEFSRIKTGINNLFKEIHKYMSKITRYLDMAGALIVVLDMHGDVVLANRKCCETLGVSEEEILGKNWVEHFIPERLKENANKVVEGLIRNEERSYERVENHIVASDGRERLIIWQNAVIRDDDGHITGVLASGEDITEKRAIHNMVAKGAERLNKAEEIAHIGSWEMNLQNKEVIWSDEFFRICGYEPGIVAPSAAQLINRIHPDDRAKFESAFDNAVINQGMYEIQIRITRPNGEMRWVLSKGLVEPDDIGHPEKITGSFLDITEIKKAERQIKQNTERSESLVRILQYNADSNQDLLDYVLNEAIKLTESKIGYIYFYDEEKKQFELSTWAKGVFNEGSVMEPKAVYQLEKIGLWGEAVRRRRPFMVNDYNALSSNTKTFPKGHARTRKFLTIPVFSDEKIVAVIGVANKETDYTQIDILQLTLLMNSVWEIFERKKTDSLLKEERERFRTTLLSVGDGVISTDKNGNIEIINEVAQRLTGWSEKDAMGKPFDQVFHIINEHTREECESPVKRVLESGRIIELRRHTLLISRDGVKRPITDSAAPILDDSGEIHGVVMVFRDFTEEKLKQDEIEYLSYHDQLTGIYNRRFYEEELKRLDQKRNLPLSVVMGDVNGLKLTNDAFGHAVGDKLLQTAARIMKETCRQDDIIARLGGDEFIMLLPRTSDEETERIVGRIRTAMAEVEIDSVMLSISFGWDAKVNENDDISDVLKKAEDCMYACKLFESPSMRGQTIYTIIKTLHEKNIREKQHSERVSKLCGLIGNAMALNEKAVNELKTAGLLHDIGKIAVSEHTLNKIGKLSQEEWNEIKRHPEIGYRIMSTVNDMSDLAEYVLAHHERYDGTGYPKGLSGEAIPMQARIISVADAYDAMTSPWPYRVARTEDDAVLEIVKNAGVQFDPLIARLFVEKVLGKVWERHESA